MILTTKIAYEGTTHVVYFSGSINEEAGARLAELDGLDAARCIFDFRDIVHINSSGVRLWLSFIRRFCAHRQVSYQRCPPVIVSQIAMIDSFCDKANVTSIYTILHCDQCGFEASQLSAQSLDGARLTPDIAKLKCQRCAEELTLKDQEENEIVLALMTAAAH